MTANFKKREGHELELYTLFMTSNWKNHILFNEFIVKIGELVNPLPRLSGITISNVIPES